MNSPLNSWFHPALPKLLSLQFRGSVRQFRKSLRTARGLIQFLFMAAMMLYGAGSLYFFGRMTSNDVTGTIQTVQQDLLTVGLFIGTVSIVVFSSGDAAVYFTASEVAYLFPAPIPRRQLLLYKLLKSLLGIMAVSLLFSLLTTPPPRMALARWLGTILTISFLQLVTMNVAFLRQIAEGKIQQTVRRIIGIAVGIAVIYAASEMMQRVEGGEVTALMKAFHTSPTGQVLLLPFEPFARMLRAGDWSTFAMNGSLVFLADAVLLTVALQLDALSLEAALAVSEKLTSRMKRIQTQGIWHAMGAPSSSAVQRRIPRLPFWGGMGPIAWQRTTSLLRTSKQLLTFFSVGFVFAGVLVYFASRSKQADLQIPFSTLGPMAYLSFLICISLQNEIDRVGFLKSLPLRSTAIVVGELLGIVVILSAAQSLFITAVMVRFPHLAVPLLSGMALALPLNFLLFAVDKIVFYVYPTRMAKGAPGDFQNSGRQLIYLSMKISILMGCALVLGVAAIPGALLNSPVIAIGSSVIMLLIECAVSVPLLTLAFNRFDPSTTNIT